MIYVIAKCVSCGSKKKVYAGEGQPFCETCYSPMIAESSREVEDVLYPDKILESQSQSEERDQEDAD